MDRRNKRGFTLVELMIVVCIIGILSAIAIPRFAETIRRSQEARTKGNLGALRSALALYYTETEGIYPQDRLQCLTLNARYLREIPLKYTPPYHPAGNTVGAGGAAAMSDAREDWFYFSLPSDKDYGKVVVNCIHSDLRGNPWANQ